MGLTEALKTLCRSVLVHQFEIPYIPQMMNVEQDEDEHSIEMHLSYIARIMEPRKGQFTVVPVLVGSLSHEKQVNHLVM